METSNVKAMREALDRIGNIAGFVAENCGDQQTATYMTDIISEVLSAIAIPPRNCDVGTVEEQHQRFIDYCNACNCPMGCIYRKEFVGMLDTRCASMLKCYIRWSQM